MPLPAQQRRPQQPAQQGRPPVGQDVRGRAVEMYRDAILRRLGTGGAPTTGVTPLEIASPGEGENPLSGLMRNRTSRRVMQGMGGQA